MNKRKQTKFGGETIAHLDFALTIHTVDGSEILGQLKKKTNQVAYPTNYKEFIYLSEVVIVGFLNRPQVAGIVAG